MIDPDRRRITVAFPASQEPTEPLVFAVTRPQGSGQLRVFVTAYRLFSAFRARHPNV
jgi:hypothetical protein